MRVILLQNIPGLGQKDEVKEVKVGYWRNFLMLQGLAIKATEDLLKQVEVRKEKEKEAKEYEKKQFVKTLESLKDKTLIIEKKADDTGSLFDGIDAKELSETIKEKMRFEIDESLIKLEKPIKKIGTYEVLIKDVVLKVEVKTEH